MGLKADNLFMDIKLFKLVISGYDLGPLYVSEPVG